MLGLELGDAEVIRNAGGRVTMDVLRSLVVCQDLLDCHTVLVIHHTDCGGQEVARRHLEVKNKLWDHLMHAPHASWALRMASRVAYYGSMRVPPFMRQWAFKAVVHPIYGLEKELHDDLVALRRSSLINPDTALYGLIYFVHNGALKLVEKDEGSRGRSGGGKMKGQEMKEEEEEEEEEDEGPQ
jgi:carbonic anhydrase